MPEAASLRLLGVGKRFGETLALSSVDLEVQRGEIHGVLGQNGAGKSTLVKILTGIHPAGTYSGRVLIGGREVHFSSPHDARNAGVGYVPQESESVPDLDVVENVLAGRVTTGRWFRRSDAERRAGATLERLGVRLPRRVPVGALSAANKQLVMIARALAGDPEILILDEPTTSLSETEAHRLGQVVQGLARDGLSIIYITHRVREVMAICDTATILRDGRVAERFRAQAFSERAIVAGMAGREIARLYPDRSVQPGEPVMTVDSVSTRARAGAGIDVHDVSFTLHRGEILGVAGVLGSGRSELLMALYGQSPRTGSVRVGGREVAPSQPRAARKAGIGLLTEDRKSEGLLFNLSVGRNVTIGNLALASRFGLMRGRLENRVAQGVVQRQAVKVPSLSGPVTQLSGGNQQKLLLGRCLLAAPRVVLLDEPTKGVDVGTRQQIYGQIAELSDRGVGVLVVSSELDELLGMSDRVLVLSRGRVVDEFRRGEGDEERILSAATLTGPPADLRTPA